MNCQICNDKVSTYTTYSIKTNLCTHCYNNMKVNELVNINGKPHTEKNVIIFNKRIVKYNRETIKIVRSFVEEKGTKLNDIDEYICYAPLVGREWLETIY